ncbi:MAG TPA: ATP-binding cassette domain-containing protein [Acidimicrobiales bacterium]|nr:ATP-binding cassette domain-containing protein [Acidimicrobiales bacterium]
MAAVEISDLVVRYGSLTAVAGVSFEASVGEVVALLGPNGAGKTTTIETLEGYRRPTSGAVRVLGLDPVAARTDVMPHIGVMLQRGGVYPSMTALDAVRLFASYYDGAEDPAALLDRVGLTAVAHTRWRKLSGGEQQRLSLALALVGRPAVAFLDEPTAGVDPAGRLAIRSVIGDLRDRGTCVLLATHELDEAEHVADRVVIVDHGRVVTSGTTAELRAGGDTHRIRFSAPAGLDTEALGAAVGASVAERAAGEYEADTEPTPATVARLTAWLAEHNLALADLRTGRQTLEEAFLRLTGPGAPAPRPAGEPGAAHEGMAAGHAAEQRGAGAASGEAGPTVETPPTPVADRRIARLVAQTRAEITMTLRRGESVLLALGIPVLLLVFFSLVDVLPTGTDEPVDFLAPGILALAVMSTAMVGLAIATGFEREYVVLKRLGTTPLRRGELLAAKTAGVLAVLAVQVAVLVPVALALGWRPGGGAVLAVTAVLLACVGFAGLGLTMAGALPAMTTLAAANGLYLVLLLLGGMVVPLGKLPGGLRVVARALPAAALSEALHGALADGASVPNRSWLVLAAWAVVAPILAALTFRWE